MNSLSFFLHWLSDPRQVGAVTPSSPALAALMTAEISPRSAPVIELGPGSGAFTRALLDRGIPQRRLVLVEQSPAFVVSLRERFPHARVFCADAATLGSIDVFPAEDAGAIVSGLPLLLMPPAKVGAILAGAFRRLRKGGAFYQFTYGTRSPVPHPILDRLGLTTTLVGKTLANIPPAAVYRIEQRRAARPAEFHAERGAEQVQRFEHRVATSLMQAGDRPVPIQESFHHGIRNFPQRQQRGHSPFRGA